INLLEDKLEIFKSKNPALFEKIELIKQQKDEEKSEDSRHNMMFDAVDHISSQPVEQAIAGGDSQEFYVSGSGIVPQQTQTDDFSDIDDQSLEDELMKELPLPPPPKVR
ncbi:hypothetical protein HN448_05680, partial [archaeon]|nr:hypothetical protein [archaeon]